MPIVTSRRVSTVGLPPAPLRPAFSHRPSVVSEGSSSWQASCLRVLSLTSSTSTPLLAEPPSPVGHIAPQNLTAQLTAWATSSQGPQNLKLYTWLREAMLRSDVFELFEDGAAVQNLCLRRLRAMPHQQLCEIVAHAKEIIAWRQDGIGPAKMSDPRSAAEIVGLLTACRALMGAAGTQQTCEVAKANISAQQPVEKRFNVTLLAVAVALLPPGGPVDFTELRLQCKQALQLMKYHRPKLQRERRLRLMKRIGRVLTFKQADKLPGLPDHLAALDAQQDSAVANTPSDGQFIIVDSALVQNQAVQSAPDKQAYTKNWLSSLWS